MDKAALPWDWMVSPWTKLLLYHHMNQPPFKINLANPKWFRKARGLDLLINSVTTTDPDQSPATSLSISCHTPIVCQIYFTRLHINRRCLISSQASLQAGQVPEFSMCLLARTPLHSSKPCRTRHPKFFILAGTLSFHKFAHTSSSPTTLACSFTLFSPNLCNHWQW
jgi:hypothetical protein